MDTQNTIKMNDKRNLNRKEAILFEADDTYDSDPGYLTDGSSQRHSNPQHDNSLLTPTRRDLTEEETERKRVTANSQERCRMQRLNYELENLRRCLPPQLQVCHRRLSKIKTLKLAANYISTLAEILDEHCASNYYFSHRLTLSTDPRFIRKTDVCKDADVFRPGKRQHVGKSPESQSRKQSDCQYSYHEGISMMNNGVDFQNSDMLRTSHHRPVLMYKEMTNGTENVPCYNISKDQFGHPSFPWYHKDMFVPSNHSSVIQQL